MRISGEARYRWVLASLLSCVALFVLAPNALAAGAGGISGTVTSACACEDFSPLKDIEVTVYEAGESGLPVGFATTNAKGEYVVEGLPGGSYEVEFSPEFESGRNYVTQYYKGQTSSVTAGLVAVAEGHTTEGINAELQVGGKIEGAVTEAVAPHDALGNIEVTAYRVGEEGFPVGYATTNASGQYTIVGLGTGSYKVRFSVGFESSLNFVAQYYLGASTRQAATSIEVKQEQTTPGIDAELQVGGEITGTVTDAFTHAAVSRVEVVALGASEAVDGVAFTNASGQYTIAGLASGSYKIGFASPTYIIQYYSDELFLAGANPVTVAQGSTTSGINAALVRKAPVNTGAPIASGTPTVGDVLSCSTGAWTGSPTPVFTYSWLRDGVAISGANQSTYDVQTADQGNGLTCKVTATNKSGSASALSNTLTVQIPKPPAPPPPVPMITIRSSVLGAFGGAVRIRLACARSTCAGTIELTERVVVRHRRGRHTTISRKTLVLGRASYALAAGRRGTVVVRLNATGRRVLAGGRRSRRVSATVVVSVISGVTVRKSVLIRTPIVLRGRLTARGPGRG
jgi:hypothetical protein